MTSFNEIKLKLREKSVNNSSNGKFYYVGYWDNNKPNGFFFRYGSNKIINFKGFLLKDFSIDPTKKGKVFFKNGERYEGYFAGNNMNGFGTYYFPAGNSFTGNFTNGKFNGTGKYFYDNGLITEMIQKNCPLQRHW